MKPSRSISSQYYELVFRSRISSVYRRATGLATCRLSRPTLDSKMDKGKSMKLIERKLKRQKVVDFVMENERKNHDTGYFQWVTHASINPAGEGLTSVMQREPLPSLWYQSQTRQRTIKSA